MTTAKPSSSRPVVPIRKRNIGSDSPFSTWGSLQSILMMAVLMATLFTVFMPANLFTNESLKEYMFAAEPENNPTALPASTATSTGIPRIGIISGHKGNDSGAVCPDGFLPGGLTTEAQVNERIATLVVQKLSTLGYQVDMLEEFDPKLIDYQGMALVSIHNDSCEYYGNEATGYKVAAAMMNSIKPQESERLTTCLIQRYGEITGMQFHFSSITPDMTYYHVFNEISSNTPAAIIETGFLNIDGNQLVTESDKIAQGVVNGILCYINNEPIEHVQTPTPTVP